MSTMYGKLYVDEKYSPMFEPILYYDTWMIPGVTYTDQYQMGNAGTIYVPKLKNAGATQPKTPARDFEHKLVENELLSIRLNNNYQESDKLYQVQVNAIEAPIATEVLSNTTAKVREGINNSGLAALITEGTNVTSADDITSSNVRDALIDARTSLVSSKGRADIILCTPEFYALILKAAGREFTPNINERIQMSGQVGNWLGYTIMEVNSLANTEAVKYYNYADELKTVTSTELSQIQFIMYNHRAFSSLTNLEAYRMVDGGKDFLGSLAQVEVNQGFRVTNSANVKVYKKKTTSGSGDS